jgi:hypothetical protein
MFTSDAASSEGAMMTQPDGRGEGGLIASGIIQNVGAALFIIGVTVKVGGPDRGATIGPSGVGSGSGIGVRGTF